MLSSIMEVASISRAQLQRLTGKTDAQISRWLKDWDAVPLYVRMWVEAWPFISEAGKRHLMSGGDDQQTVGKGRSSLEDVDANIKAVVRVATRIMKDNPDVSYTRTALSEAIAATGEVPLKAQQIYKRYIICLYAELDSKYITGDGGRMDRFQYRR